MFKFGGDLLKGFKKTYLAADLEGKAAILGAFVDRATLRNGDLFVSWKKPFDVLFILEEGVLKTKLGSATGIRTPV